MTRQAPVIRAGIAQRAEHAVHRHRFIGLRRQFEFDGIERNGIGPRKIALAVNEMSDDRPMTIRRQRKPPGRHRRRLAGQRDVNVAFRW